MTKLTAIEAIDVRFPTSRFLDGSDAMNPDPDYSAAYCILHTSDDALKGYGMTFTIGRGTELCVSAIRSLATRINGLDIDEVEQDLAGFSRRLTGDSQIRWLGPEKGIVHLAAAALINAMWDLLARRANKPLWRYLLDMPLEQLAAVIDYRHISDALDKPRAIELLQERWHDRDNRQAALLENGHEAYTTSAGWLGYPDEKIIQLATEARLAGWTAIKIKVGRSLDDDQRRMAVLRELLGPDFKLMIDANQVWEVNQAIDWVRELARFDPYWIEEPVSPDDILGHRTIREAVNPIRVATGEHCHNRIMFKQFLQAGAIDVVQLDACRLAGVNEVLAVLLMAAAYNKPVCPHAGGVGLCEYVQHISYFDEIAVAPSLAGRMTEHAGHLHEHFVDPIQIRAGRYLPPQQPGFSVQFKASSLSQYRFPEGSYWQSVGALQA